MLRCIRYQPLLLAFLIPALVSAAPATKTAESSTTPFTPVFAELMGSLDAKSLKPGSQLLLKVKVAWKNDDCRLREGAILRGHVLQVNPSTKENRVSQIAVSIDQAECNGPDLVPMQLSLVAMLAPDPAEAAHLQAYAPLSNSLVATGVSSGSSTSALRSVTAAASVAENSPMPVDVPKRLAPGGVYGIPGITLSVGTGPEDSSVLLDKGHNVALQPYTRFVMVPSTLLVHKTESGLTSRASESPSSNANGSASNASGALPKATPAPPAESDIDVCAPPSCNTILAADTVSEGRSASSFSLRDLGYAPRYGIEIDGFGHDAALAYLGRNQLLVTFNPHTLIRRASGESSSSRIVRAVLLELPSMRVTRTVDWHLVDRNQYLWSAGPDRVLAHVGNELRLYGPDLRIVQRIELGRPLAWVRVAPSKKNFAVGVVIERHSREVHTQLAAESATEPEEDIEIRILDAGFNTVATAVRSSRYLPPVLTDEGEVGLYSQGNSRWHLVEHNWSHQTKSITHLTSSCMPRISSMEPDLLFVLTCDRTSGVTYRVLQPDGKPLLKGFSPSSELEQSARGSDPGQEFVISIAQADRPLMPGEVFHPSDLTDEQLAVYRASDGKRMFATRIAEPAAAAQAYALAPGGENLAVLSGEQILLYAIPH
jgi:hypothetical protein